MNNTSAGSTVIKNITAILEATELLEDEVMPSIYKSMSEQISNFMAAETFSGSADPYADDGQFFLDSDWLVPEETAKTDDQALAWYYMYSTAWESSDSTAGDQLESLVGERGGHFEFIFMINRKEIPGSPKKREFEQFCAKTSNDYPQIKKSGFIFRDSEWHLEWKLDINKLAECYEQEVIEDALAPLKDALNKIKIAHPEFKKIVDLARSQFENQRASSDQADRVSVSK